MKVNVNAIAKTIGILIFLTVLPIIGRRWIPEEAFRFLMLQSGFDLIDILNRIAIIGVIVSMLILVTGHVEIDSREHLIISIAWKAFWLFIVIFLLDVGYPETLGLAKLGVKSGGAENIVVFDFRLFIVLATVVVILMIIRSILQFKEKNTKSAGRIAVSNKLF
ncbi:hypothetical protein MUP77_24200 [Candidatus Bathyarchaeota archaeon]|nr:hypothetical protein [Candidatus Bathyarchaeota archaeon]